MAKSKIRKIINVMPREGLTGFARKKAKRKEEKSIANVDVEEYLEKGWIVGRENKNTKRMSKPKEPDIDLEDRVWTVLWKMGFQYLTGDAQRESVLQVPNLDQRLKNQADIRYQIDNVAIGSETAVMIECKASRKPMKSRDVEKETARLKGIKNDFNKAIESHLSNLGDEMPREVAAVLWTSNWRLTEEDRKRAFRNNVLLLDDRDLDYYENLVKQIGPAARYHFLSDAFKGQSIEGLQITVPGVKMKMNDHWCYSFSIRPDFLLKIVTVAHRTRGGSLGTPSYQRLISRGRLKKIQEFITDGGIFPTNVVVNIEKSKDISWEEAPNAKATRGVSGNFGMITLKPKYGSAFIIDGQHRLYSYSGHPRSEKSLLSVLAFAGLDAVKQSQMFVDINSEQKKVPRKLLIDLNADLLWDSPDTKKLMVAIGTKVVQGLNKREPLLERVSLAEGPDTDTKCIGLTAIHKELMKPGFFMEFIKGGSDVPQVFWRNSRKETVERSVKVIADWLRRVSEPNQEWWDLGKADGGGLAMSASTAACLGALRQTLIFLNSQHKLAAMSVKKLIEELETYGDALGIYFQEMTVTERLEWRKIPPSNQGYTKAVYQCLEAIQKYHTSFCPEGLKQWQEQRKNQTNEQCMTVITKIEASLKKGVEFILREEFPDDDNWWYDGVPPKIQKAASEKETTSKGKTKYLQNVVLIDYQKIITKNWSIMKTTFGYGEGNTVGKDRGTKWIGKVNEKRNKVSHAGSIGQYLGPGDLEELEGYAEWLGKQIQHLEDPNWLSED